MKLVIAEKPSVGRAIAAAVGATSRKDGYIEGGNYVITWCRGHLVDLAMPGSYEVWAGSWSLEKLPMIPDKWIWEPVKESGAKDQLAIIKKLAERDDVDTIVNACDADREGEGIFRRVYDYLGLKKPVERFWSTSLVDDAVRKDLSRMKPGSEYDGLGDAAEGRAKADWLVGMNGSRAYTLMYDAKPALSVGRVQTPVLAMVVEQTRKVEGFVSEPFWRVLADLGGFTVSSERFGKLEDAYALAAKVSESAGEALVTSVERKDVKATPPTLYDLTGLQRDASTRCGMTADATMSALQSLYEKKLATYPRTDSKYITSDDADEAAALLPRIAVAGIVGEAAASAFDMGRADIKRVVNDKKVSGHGALLPTSELDAEAMRSLSGDERNIMLLICGRLLAAVMEPGMRTHTKVAVDIAGTEFTASGSIVKDASWIGVDEALRAVLRGGEKEEKGGSDSENERIPADFEQGDTLAIAGSSVKEGKTSAPKYYTDATLLSAMENAGRTIEDTDLKAAINDDSSHSGGLGTPATRADTIERLIEKGYCKRKGRSIIATETGKALVDTISDESLKSPVLTAEWEEQLMRVEREGASLDEFLDGIARYTAQIVQHARDNFDPTRFAADPVGCCPLCGKDVVASKSGKSWHCVDQRWVKKGDKFEQAGACTFSIGRVAGKSLTERQVKDLLAGKRIHVKGLKSKKGSLFETDLVLDESGKVAFSWPKSPKSGNKRKKSEEKR